MSLALPLAAKEVVLSEKPIPIRIPVGQELIIKFPQPATHTRNLNDAATISSLLTPDGILYVTPTQKFDKSRVVAELVDGRMVMLDIEAADTGPFDSDITIVERPTAATAVRPAAAPAATPSGSAAVIESPAPDDVVAKNPYKPDFLADGEAKTLNVAMGDYGGTPSREVGNDYHHMVRYGFRHYVGPARLIGDDLGKPVKVGKSDIAKRLLRMNDGRLSVKPLRQWQIGDNYLTVLLVNNLSTTAVEFDPRAMRGRWMFAAALYPVIEPRGSRLDQTLWALISSVPFDKAVE
ncbi:DUF3438 family protein [uncultured Cardiobacterium sp.]|uniref:DUF3438 family protein n=1 Tax=uncultured Cardiobacterium sp. TaxID=417619 RepID=UPI00260DBB3B|nr:DUF3438 family protein [uncultured Cardiobacterium sp.]